MTTVAVIIPYFQRQAGILRRALNSVLKQNLPADVKVDIIVTDDGSPAPAHEETRGLNFAGPFRLQLIEQPNSGVSAARNAGLRAISADTTYIAFLDSDDSWDPDHLATAITALEKGYDFYFCDSQRSDVQYTAFSENSFDRLLLPSTRMIGDNVYELDAAPFFDFSLRHWLSRTPTIVYRHSLAPNLLFDISVNFAGEDCLFFLELITKCSKVCRSPLVVNLGEGINIYYGHYSWDQPQHLMMHMSMILSFYAWRKNFSLSEENQRFLATRIKEEKKLFAFLTLRYFIKKREFWPPRLTAMTRSDPQFWMWYPTSIAYVLICYPLGLFHPTKYIK